MAKLRFYRLEKKTPCLRLLLQTASQKRNDQDESLTQIRDCNFSLEEIGETVESYGTSQAAQELMEVLPEIVIDSVINRNERTVHARSLASRCTLTT